MKIQLTKINRKSLVKYVAIAAFAGVFIGCQTESDDTPDPLNFDDTPTFTQSRSTPIVGQYIVTLKKGTFTSVSGKGKANYQRAKASFKREALNLFKETNITEENIKETFGFALEGFSAKLSEEQLKALRNDPNVISVEQDYYVVQNFPVIKAKPPGAGNGNGGGGGNDPQQTPYGITRVSAGQTYTGSKTAWIIDSGIDLDHPDLNVDAARSVSYDTRDSNPNDDHGHGTHVAGTVAAIDNSEGVVGVAAGTTVVAVRVVNRRGGGSASWCVSGVDYVAANASPGDVANMSLGYPANTAIDNAVLNAASLGIDFALAAGNDGAHAGTGPSPSPARVNGPNIYTVSAMNSSDNFASFSNYGNPPVDYCAPGVSVLSCWKGGGYNTISGTSMASPHVAGLLIWGNISTSGTVNGDPDGNPDPIASR
ncbi:S8 family serine peptidase [Pseudotenacibaculum haliotis]|uniref:S8 family serine peptidase n=1 Tax=Pseudotenacibaculum haliotis TaxID=1862138 RepID=A0ABW5LQY7_9FLAO